MNEIKRRSAMGMSLKWACLLLMLSLAGCGGKPVWDRDDPTEVVNAFLQATEAQSTETMWAFLTTETREKLQQRADAFNSTSQNGANRRGSDMIRTGHVYYSTREFKKLEVAASGETEAVVNMVMHDETVIAIKLYREDGRWAVSLPL